MNVVKCIRFSSLLRPTQCLINFTPIVVPKRSEWNYSKKEGIPREFITILTQDYDLSRKGIRAYLERSQWTSLKEDHKFIPDRHRILGPELATAHFMVKRGAKVKFSGRNTWFQKDEKGNTYLPNQFVPGLFLEAIDASGFEMSYVAFDNMIHLEELRFLNFSGSKNFNDWCLARLYQFADTLEFLDISDCVEVTENGLTCLHSLKNLKGLKLTGLPNVRDIGLMVLLLEEALPECTVFGVDPDLLLPPGLDPHSALPDRVKAISDQLSTDESEVHLRKDTDLDGSADHSHRSGSL